MISLHGNSSKNFKTHVKLNFSSLTGDVGLWPAPIFQIFLEEGNFTPLPPPSSLPSEIGLIGNTVAEGTN